ncbi:TPA: hypothetical protein DDW35_05580 [Candidatus Sumerlaeota bacterium]|nr:hypothetical protein [Candidatus Sumerlaeota bacterium]
MTVPLILLVAQGTVCYKKRGVALVAGVPFFLENGYRMSLPAESQSVVVAEEATEPKRDWAAIVRLIGLLLVIIAGIVPRLTQYVFNRSLWLDESFFALNFTERSFMGLFHHPLDYDQSAPIGVLLVCKLFMLALGDSEYVLRLLPLIGGIAGLFCFWKLAAECVGVGKPHHVPFTMIFLSVVLLATCERLIYYASEFKPYSTDATVAVLLFLGTATIMQRGITIRRAVWFGIGGVVAFWFSFPAVFVLGGVSCALLLHALKKKDVLLAWCAVVMSMVWVCNFVGYYALFLSQTVQSPYLQGYWQNAFMPLPLGELSFNWFTRSLSSFIREQLGLSVWQGSVTLLLIVGLFAICWRSLALGCLFLVPVFLTIAASAVHKYPFTGRLILFLVPSFLLVIAEGIGWIQGVLPKPLRWLGWILIALFVLPLVGAAFDYVPHPRSCEETRPMMQYMKQNLRPGDTVYVYYKTETAFKYYAHLLPFSFPNVIIGKCGRENSSVYYYDLQQLRGKERVWILFSHIYYQHGDEEKLFLKHLGRMGEPLDTRRAPGASVYLYDLSKSR